MIRILITYISRRWRVACCVGMAVMLLFGIMSCSGNDGEQVSASCVEDLDGHTVAVITGTTQDIELSKNHPNVVVQRYNSIAELLMAVSSGKAEFMFADSVYCIDAGFESYGIKMAFYTPLCGGNIALPFRKNDSLKVQFDAFYEKILLDGTLHDLVARWTTGNVSQMSTPSDVKRYSDGVPLIVGTQPGYPFEFVKNDEWTGLEIELVLRFAAYLQRPVVIKSTETAAMIPALHSNKIDVAASQLFITEERCKMVDFSNSYYYSSTGCWQRCNNVVAKQDSFVDKLYNNVVAEDRWKMLLYGLYQTLVIAFFSLLFGTLFGVAICRMHKSRKWFVAACASLYVKIMRAIPLLVFLMAMYYLVFANMKISATVVAIAAFSLYFAAFVSEMFKMALNSIDRGQRESALAMGFNNVQTFFTIVLPQAVRIVVPIYKGEAITLIKNTSIVGYVAILDLTKVSDIIRSRTFDALVPLVVISIVYFLMAFLLGKLLDYWSLKMNKNNKQ